MEPQSEEHPGLEHQAERMLSYWGLARCAQTDHSGAGEGNGWRPVRRWDTGGADIERLQGQEGSENKTHLLVWSLGTSARWSASLLKGPGASQDNQDASRGQPGLFLR